VTTASALTLTAQFDRFSAGRVRDGDALSLVLPPDTVARLVEMCASARAMASKLPLVAGTEAIEDLLALLDALLAGFSAVVAADALALRSTDTLEQALEGLEQLRAELRKR
jgi:tRNA1(Val) A37 N6-methylase TrmN6